VLPAETAPAATLTRRQKKVRTSPNPTPSLLSQPPINEVASTENKERSRHGLKTTTRMKKMRQRALQASKPRIKVSSGSTALVQYQRQCGAARRNGPCGHLNPQTKEAENVPNRTPSSYLNLRSKNKGRSRRWLETTATKRRRGDSEPSILLNKCIKVSSGSTALVQYQRQCGAARRNGPCGHLNQ
jgi:hypothetical protein